MLKKWMLALLVSSIAIGACSATDKGAGTAAPVPDKSGAGIAADPATETIRKALLKYVPGLKIDAIAPAPMPGYYQIIAGGQLAYVSTDGKYLMHGDLISLDNGRTISDDAWASYRKAELAKVPQAQRIVFAPAHPKYRVTVFTDVTCAYCRALHQQIAEFNKAGIEVDYLAWPREGIVTTAGRDTPTYTEMVSVWCAADRNAAFTAAKQDKPPKPATCANPVKAQFEMGERLGITGTPMVIADDGSVVGGYVTPEKLLQILQDPKNHRMPEAP